MAPTADREAVVREILAAEQPRNAAGDVARRHGIDKGLAWRWALEAAREQAEQRLSVDALMARLLDPAERARLLADAGADRTLTLLNRLHDLMLQCDASAQDIRALFAALAPDGSEDFEFDQLLYHPNVDEGLLFELLDQGRCITALGHRAGPRRLLERLADERSYSEAITTLALYHYSRDDYPLDDFVAFVRKHRDDLMLQWNLERADNLSPARKSAALAALDTRGS